MKKYSLIILGVVLLVLGILALIPAVTIPSTWLAIIVIIVGLISFLMGLTRKPKKRK